MIKTVAPALRALLEGLIDYAGLFPPAALPLEEALENYTEYKNGEYAWMLRWFVVSGSEAERIPPSFDGALSILAGIDQPRAAAIESTATVASDRPVYVEAVPRSIEILDEIKKSGNFAKIRMGGVKPEAIPSSADVAAFIIGCAERKLPFKATAGLHHPIRAEYALTYEKDAPRAVMHGFLNVLIASAFAWYGRRELVPILSETDASNFKFDNGVHWRDLSLTVEEVRQVRQKFMHSIGSCSFEEPLNELQTLGLL